MKVISIGMAPKKPRKRDTVSPAKAREEASTVTDGAIGNTENPQKPLVASPVGQVLDLNEACELLSISKPTMYKYLKEQIIPAFKYPGSRVWKFDREQLQQWVKSQQQKGGHK
jgi:excisionase family DNA binding protein